MLQYKPGLGAQLKAKKNKHLRSFFIYKKRTFCGVHKLIVRKTPLSVRKKCQTSATPNSKQARREVRASPPRKNLFLAKLKNSKPSALVPARGQDKKKLRGVVRGVSFLFRSGNGVMVDQQLGFLVQKAAANFRWSPREASWLLRRPENNTSCTLVLDKKRELWNRLYEYNARTLLPAQRRGLERRALSAWGLSFADRRWFLQVHPLVITLLSFCWQKGWLPVAAQLPVGTKFERKEQEELWGQKNLGTFIDLVVFEPGKSSGTLWALEVKKMQEGPQKKGGGGKPPMYLSPLACIEATGGYSAALVQAGLGEALLRLNYDVPWEKVRLKSGVLRVYSGGVGLTPIPRSWTQALSASLPLLR